MSLFVPASVIGLLVLLAWPVLRRRQHQRHKRLRQPTIGRDSIPPRDPGEQPPPGSAPYRHGQGKP